MTHLEPGDLLLWDSRVLHCNQPGLAPPVRFCRDAALGPGPDEAGPTGAPGADGGLGLLRAACFVCMVPRSRAAPCVLEERRRAVQEGLTTTHRPHLFQSSLTYDHWRRVTSEGSVPREMRL